MDVSYKPYWWSDIRDFRTSAANASSAASTFNVCSMFARVCTNLMTGIGCPSEQLVNVPCTGGAASAAEFIGLCGCGDADAAITDVATTRAQEYIIDGLTAEAIALELSYVVPSRAPGSHLVGSNNFKQFLSPVLPLPGFTTSFG